jgi:hypothetical protein
VLFIGQMNVLREIGFHVFIILVSTLFSSIYRENPQCIQGINAQSDPVCLAQAHTNRSDKMELDLTVYVCKNPTGFRENLIAHDFSPRTGCEIKRPGLRPVRSDLIFDSAKRSERRDHPC